MSAVIFEARGVVVRYPGTTALRGVDLVLRAGEVHALIGENGAGKSTLVGVLSGSVAPDEGTLLLDGVAVSPARPADAQRLGIATVHQDVAVVPSLSVAENIALTAAPSAWVRRSRSRAVAREALAAIGSDIDPDARVADLSPSERQIVAFARAVHSGARVLVLDEPTSSLGGDEVTEIFRAIRAVTAAGTAVVFVSHFVDQVYEIADRLTVLRDGHRVGEFDTGDILSAQVVAELLGAGDGPSAAAPGHPTVPDDPHSVVLAAQGIRSDRLGDAVDLEVHGGEVLGFSGLRGSGRTTVARLLGAVDRPSAGTVGTGGDEPFRSPREALSGGIVYLTEDRRRLGIVAGLSVRENILLSLQAERGWHRPLTEEDGRELALSWMETLGIRPLDPNATAGTLSGGNQQKVLIARALATAPRVLILDEPTRGIDVGTRFSMQDLVRELAADGMSVVYSSADVDEVRRVSDRILVFRDCRIVADVPAEEAAVRTLLGLMS